MRQRWADEGRPAPNITNDRHRLIAAVAGRCPVDTIAAERSWCAARGVEPADVRRRGASRRTAAARVPPANVARSLADYETIKRRRGVVDLDDLLLVLDARARGRSGVRRGRALALPSRPRRRGAGPQPRAVRTAPTARRPAPRPLPRRRPGTGDLRVQRRRSVVAGRRRSPPTRRRGRPPAPRTGAARRRSSPPRLHVLRCPAQPGDAVSARGRRSGGRGPRRRRRARRGRHSSPASSPANRRALLRDGQVAVLARTHEQLAMLRAGARRPQASRCASRRFRPGSPLAAADRRRRRRCGRRRSCGPGRTTCSRLAPPAVGGDDVRRHEQADRRVAAAALDFLREQPYGDGSGFRVVDRHDGAVRRARQRRRRRAADVPRRQGPRVAHRGRHGSRDRTGPAPIGDDGRRQGGGGSPAPRGDDTGERSSGRHVRRATARLRPQAEPVDRRACRPSASPIVATAARRSAARPRRRAHRLVCTRGGARPPGPRRCCRRRSAPTPTSRRSPRPRRRAPTSCRPSPASAR